MKLARPLKWDPEKQTFDDAEAKKMMARAERGRYGIKDLVKKAGI